jgi:hypothetical protein
MSPDDQPRPRRAAGSRTFGDVLKSWLTFSRADHVRDLSLLHDGQPLSVSAFLRDGRWRQGQLVIRPGAGEESVTWRKWPRGETRKLLAPYAVTAVRDVERSDKAGLSVKTALFRVIEFSAAGEPHTMAVPTGDVPLVRQALLRADGAAGT